MNMYTKIILATLALIFSAEAVAGRMWLDNSVKVDEVLVYHNSGYNIITVKVSPSEALETGCVPTDTHNIFSYWTQGGLGGATQSWVSLLLSAQAQGLEVNLLANTANCNTSTTWTAFGNPLGLGVAFYGARIAPQN